MDGPHFRRMRGTRDSSPSNHFDRDGDYFRRSYSPVRSLLSSDAEWIQKIQINPVLNFRVDNSPLDNGRDFDRNQREGNFTVQTTRHIMIDPVPPNIETCAEFRRFLGNFGIEPRSVSMIKCGHYIAHILCTQSKEARDVRLDLLNILPQNSPNAPAFDCGPIRASQMLRVCVQTMSRTGGYIPIPYSKTEVLAELFARICHLKAVKKVASGVFIVSCHSMEDAANIRNCFYSFQLPDMAEHHTSEVSTQTPVSLNIDFVQPPNAEDFQGEWLNGKFLGSYLHPPLGGDRSGGERRDMRGDMRRDRMEGMAPPREMGGDYNARMNSKRPFGMDSLDHSFVDGPPSKRGRMESTSHVPPPFPSPFPSPQNEINFKNNFVGGGGPSSFRSDAGPSPSPLNSSFHTYPPPPAAFSPISDDRKWMSEPSPRELHHRYQPDNNNSRPMQNYLPPPPQNPHPPPRMLPARELPSIPHILFSGAAPPSYRRDAAPYHSHSGSSHLPPSSPRPDAPPFRPRDRDLQADTCQLPPTPPFNPRPPPRSSRWGDFAFQPAAPPPPPPPPETPSLLSPPTEPVSATLSPPPQPSPIALPPSNGLDLGDLSSFSKTKKRNSSSKKTFEEAKTHSENLVGPSTTTFDSKIAPPITLASNSEEIGSLKESKIEFLRAGILVSVYHAVAPPCLPPGPPPPVSLNFQNRVSCLNSARLLAASPTLNFYILRACNPSSLLSLSPVVSLPSFLSYFTSKSRLPFARVEPSANPSSSTCHSAHAGCALLLDVSSSLSSSLIIALKKAFTSPAALDRHNAADLEGAVGLLAEYGQTRLDNVRRALLALENLMGKVTETGEKENSMVLVVATGGEKFLSQLSG